MVMVPAAINRIRRSRDTHSGQILENFRLDDRRVSVPVADEVRPGIELADRHRGVLLDLLA
jgi:hypothetical protein